MTIVLNRTTQGSFLSRYVCNVLGDVLPRRLKRLMYIGSVLGVLTQNRMPAPALLYPLNKVLTLAFDALAMRLPIFIYPFLWAEVQDEQIILSDVVYSVRDLKIQDYDDMDIWRVSVFFAKRCRPCMVYGSYQLMATDIHDLITVIRGLNCERKVCLDCENCSLEESMAAQAHVVEEQQGSPVVSFLEALKHDSTRRHA